MILSASKAPVLAGRFWRRDHSINVRESAPLVLTWCVLVILVVLPLIFIIIAGLGLVGDQPFAPLGKLVQDARLLGVLRKTFELAIAVTIVSTVLGILLALALERTDMRFGWLAHKMMIIPIMVSPLVGAVAWVTLARPTTGFLNLTWRAVTGGTTPLFSIYSFFGITLVVVLHVVPYVYVNVRSALQNVDGAMEEAAAMLGAGTLHIWRRVTLPLITPAILSSALLVFVLTLETFSVVGLLGGPAGFVTLPFNIYLAINLPPGDWNYAALQGLLLVAMTATLMFGYWTVIGSGGKYIAIGGKGFRVAGKVEGGIRRWLMALVCFYLFVAVVLPTAALMLQSMLGFTTSRLQDMVFTWINWSKLFDAVAFQRAIFNTALVGAVAATAAVFIGLLVAHFSVFERMRSLDGLAGLPLAFPGIVMGIALIFMYNGTPIYGTLWVLILAYTTQFLPFTIRSLSGPMMQLDKGMDEAGKVLGAYSARRILRITGPIIRGAVVSAWIVAFTRSIRELNVSIFLYTQATIVTPVLIWNYMEQGSFGPAAALSLVQAAALLVIVSVAERLNRQFEVA